MAVVAAGPYQIQSDFGPKNLAMRKVAGMVVPVEEAEERAALGNADSPFHSDSAAQ